MRIYAIGDLHLPGGDDKSMDVFGEHWRDHWRRIAQDWQARVKPEDVVLVPGDISWAMHLEQALPDLYAVGALPGRKILLRGNHDYWWGAITRVREALPESMYALQNDALQIGETVFCGSRGWMMPLPGAAEGDDARLYARELLRLRMSLERARRLSERGTVIAMTHFPPLGEGGTDTPVSALMEEFGVAGVVYGHLHGAAGKTAFTGWHQGVRYYFASCDGLGFRLLEIDL